MEERRVRIHDDLRGAIAGELYFDPLARSAYAQDGSLYEIDPLGVVVPRTEQDVLTVVRYAGENQIPLHARGAGTGAAGGALGPGLVIDFSRHLRRILAVTSDHVVVEPGVVPESLNQRLAPLGRRLKPIPPSPSVSTIGGMIAVDARGGRSLRFGSIGDHLDRLRVVLAQGEIADLGFMPWPAFDDESATSLEVIVRKLHNLYRRPVRRSAMDQPAPPSDRAGYAFGRAAGPDGVDLARLSCGSEGTLNLILQAVLRTQPLAAAQVGLVLPFARLIDAAAWVPACLGPGLVPSACDLHDRRTLRLARDADPLFRDWIREPAEAALFLEFEGDIGTDVAGRARILAEQATRSGTLAGEPVILPRRAECDRLLGVRRLIEPLLMRQRGGPRPCRFVDDMAVPPDRLAVVLRRLQEMLRRLGVTWTVDCHAGEGRIRLRPFLNPADPCDREKLEPIAAETCEIVLDAGGTISSSGACGLITTQFLPRQLGESFPVLRDIKDAFDPSYLLNPGKVIGDDPHLITRHLKPFPASARKPGPDLGSAPTGAGNGNPGSGSGYVRVADTASVGLEPVEPKLSGSDRTAEAGAADPAVVLPVLRWPGLDILETASSCNSCGECRTLETALRMCPSYRATLNEAASPRSQAGLIRQVASGAIDPRTWGGEEFKAHADLCIHCHLCKSECPAGVDVSSLMIEAKAAYVENHGLPPGDWVFSRLEMWARMASRFPIISNFVMSRRGPRWLLERLLGVSRHRVLPRVRRTPFTRRAIRLGLTQPRPHLPGPRVVYFLDVIANYYDHELAESVVFVLQQAGVNVFVPPRQRSSGMASLIVGDVDHARDLAVQNLRVLGNAVRDGFTVVCSEPTAALMLREEYVKFTDDLDAALVAQNTMDLGQYLLGLDARGQLPRPTEPLPVRVAYHQPCHLRALGVGLPGLELIRKIPGLDAEFVDRGCSGMGGTYGLRRDHFRTSLRAGRGLHRRLQDDDIEVGATECGACRIQMEQGITKRTIHPIKLLSLGYGLSPSLRRHLKEPKPRHVMS